MSNLRRVIRRMPRDPRPLPLAAHVAVVVLCLLLAVGLGRVL